MKNQILIIFFRTIITKSVEKKLENITKKPNIIFKIMY